MAVYEDAETGRGGKPALPPRHAHSPPATMLTRLPTLLLAGTAAALLCVPLTPLAAQAPAATDVSDLPITEVPSPTGQVLAVFWSGDGGWQALTSDISKTLAANGVAVVGVNARSWLERGHRTPDDVARDTERLLRAYLAKWNRSRIVLLGYSRGADLLPFVLTRLPADLRSRVELAGMLGIAPAASFEFHLMDLVKDTQRPTDIPLMPELRKVSGIPMLCVYGTQEEHTICPSLEAMHVTVVRREGDHHFDRNYPEIAQDILKAMPAAR